MDTNYVPFGTGILSQEAQENYASWIAEQYRDGRTSDEQLDAELAAGYITDEQYQAIKQEGGE